MRLSRTKRSAIVMLIDRSGSTGDTLPDGGSRVCDQVARAANNTLEELCLLTAPSGTVNDVLDIAVMGFGNDTVTSLLPGTSSGSPWLSIEGVAKSPCRLEEREGIKRPIWIESGAEGSTPMRAAVRHARELLEQWFAARAEAYFAMVLLITDGMPTDGDPLPEALALGQSRCAGIPPLLMTVHVSADPEVKPIDFPSSESELNSEHSRLMYRMASVVPPEMRAQGLSQDLVLKPNARAAFTTSPRRLSTLFRLGTHTVLQTTGASRCM
jgi:hypothetical protein